MKVWQRLLIVILLLVPGLASAETVEVTDDLGGFVYLYQLRWEKLAAQKATVRISGRCTSGCKILLDYIPRKDICVTPKESRLLSRHHAICHRSIVEGLSRGHSRLNC